jgi:periplasmic copper chaperone A
MRSAHTKLFLTFIILLILASCNTENDASDTVEMMTGEGIDFQNAWARPGSEGRMSAGYFRLINHESEPDTLTGVSSGVANLTEIHESYEMEGGMMGMREVPELVIPPQSTVNFEPGGLHIMFIQLTEPLIADEEIELTLTFTRSGEKTISVEVRP